MYNLLKASGRVAGTLFAAGLLMAAQAKIARPGTVNYAEGQVSLDGRNVSTSQIGSAEVAPGQVLETQNGKAEMLLTPGVFLRLDDHSAVRMVNPSLTDTRVELLQGDAMLEAAQVKDENHLNILDRGTDTLIKKHGLYEFRAGQVPTVAVFDGKVEVQQDDKNIEFGKGKELVIGQNKPQKFDRDSAESADSLYAWSKLRSEYEAEANAATAPIYVAGGPGWYGTGWYWNPYFSSWAFLPGDGLLYSPFGWGFYSPAYYGYYAPYGYWGGGYGVYRGYGGYRAYSPVIRGGRTNLGAPHVAAPRVMPSMPSAPRMMSAPRMAAPMGGGGVHFGGRR